MSGGSRSGPSAFAMLDGISAIAGDYDGVLSDIWGVVHNGLAASPEACDALMGMRRGGAAVVLISNAPRPSASVQAQLDALGVSREAYDGIVTSGDITHDVLRDHPGQAVFHLGPERDRPIFEGLEVSLVGAGEARLVVNTGLFDDDTETPDDYRELLSELAARRVEMVCANPDIVVERGSRLLWCAGALAEIYQALGGPVVWAGKPHPPIYERALHKVESAAGRPVPRARVLAIGDSVRTDLAGAAAMGLDCLFVAEGIHAGRTGRGAAVDTDVLAEMFAEAGVSPRAVMPRLAW